MFLSTGFIIRAISRSNKILAIKIVWKCLDKNLKDSKEYVEALSADIGKPTEAQGTYLVLEKQGEKPTLAVKALKVYVFTTKTHHHGQGIHRRQSETA